MSIKNNEEIEIREGQRWYVGEKATEIIEIQRRNDDMIHVHCLISKTDLWYTVSDVKEAIKKDMWK